MSGRRVLATLGLIVMATVVLPPLAAFAVNRARVRSAAAAVRAIAEALRAEPWTPDSVRGAEVLCGEGRMPEARSHAAHGWVVASRAGWDSLPSRRRAPPADPWGNCYLVNLAATRTPGTVMWAISAGPDGIIDTPFIASSDSAVDDDVRERIR